MASRISELVTRLIAKDDASKVIENVADELEALEKQGDTAITIGAEDKASDDIRSVSEKLAALSDEDKKIVLTAQVGNAERDIERLLRSLARVDQMDQKEVDIRVTALGDARAELDRVQDELRQLDGSTADVKVDVDSTSIDDMLGKLDALPGALGGIGESLAPLAAAGGPAAGVGAIAAGLLVAVNHAKDLALEAGTTAQLTGDTVENVSKVQQLWRTTGADVNDLNDIVVQLNGALQQSPELAAKLGINLDDGKSALDRFLQVVDLTDQGFVSMTEQSQLFGEEGIRQVAALTRSYDDLQDVVAGMDPLVNEEDAENAQELDKALKGITAELEGMAVELGQDVLPLLTKVADLFGVINATMVDRGELPFVKDVPVLRNIARYTTPIFGQLNAASDGVSKLNDEWNDWRGNVVATVDPMMGVARAQREQAAEQKKIAEETKAQAEQQQAVDEAVRATVEGFQGWADAIRAAAAQQKAFEQAIDEGTVSAAELMDEFDTAKIEAATTALENFLATRQPGVSWLDTLGDTRTALDQIFADIRRNKGRIPDIFAVGTEKGRDFRDAIGEASDTVNQQLVQALENAEGNFDKVREQADNLRREMIEKIEIKTGLDMDVPAEKEKILGLVNAVVPTKRQVEVGIKLAEEDLAKLKAQLSIAELEKLLPATALQLRVDLAEGDITPEEAAATAQEALNAEGLNIDLDVDTSKADPALLAFANEEQLKLDGRPLFIPVSPNLPSDNDMKAVSIAAQDFYDSQPPVTIPVIPVWQRSTSPGSGPGAPIPDSAMVAGFAAGPTGVAPASMWPPIQIPVKPVTINQTVNFNAGTVGDPSDAMRAVDKANRRIARLLPKVP